MRTSASIACCISLLFSLCSCVIATKDTYASLGGKGAYRSATFGVVSDHEASFRDGTLAATLVAGAYYSAATAAAKEVTSQVATKQATKQAINATNAAAATEQAAIAADVTKATFVPP